MVSTPPPPTETRGAADYTFIDKAVPEKVFNAELRRIDYEQSGIERTLERIEAKIDKMEAKFDERLSKFESKFDERLSKNEAKTDERFDKMNAKIDGVQINLSAKIDNLFYWVVATMLVFAGLITSVIFAFFK